MSKYPDLDLRTRTYYESIERIVSKPKKELVHFFVSALIECVEKTGKMIEKIVVVSETTGDELEARLEFDVNDVVGNLFIKDIDVVITSPGRFRATKNFILGFVKAIGDEKNSTKYFNKLVEYLYSWIRDGVLNSDFGSRMRRKAEG